MRAALRRTWQRAAGDGLASLEGVAGSSSPGPLSALMGAFSAQTMPFTRSLHDDRMHGTTILCIRKAGKVVLIGDGQVTMGSQIVKNNMKKVRRIYETGKDPVVAGFAGSTADALSLFDLLEAKLEANSGILLRAAVDFAKDWRLQKAFGRLDATIIVADKTRQLQITGNGEVLESHDGVLSVGSGSAYALAAARALVDIPGLSAEDIANKAMKIAADSCVYTNHQWVVEVLDAEEEVSPTKEEDSGSKTPDLP